MEGGARSFFFKLMERFGNEFSGKRIPDTNAYFKRVKENKRFATMKPDRWPGAQLKYRSGREELL